MLLTTLLLCGATSIASSQTNEGAVNPDKTKTEQTLSDADKARALEFANLAAVDERLNDHAYIVPGLGDAGDRIFGTK